MIHAIIAAVVIASPKVIDYSGSCVRHQEQFSADLDLLKQQGQQVAINGYAWSDINKFETINKKMVAELKAYRNCWKPGTQPPPFYSRSGD